MGNIHNRNVSYILPGLVSGCSQIDSLLFSTLECFYSDSICFSILMKSMKEYFLWNAQDSLWFDVRPLVNHAISPRFHTNSSILEIIRSIMIEQWNPSYSYENLYKLCSPINCIYSKKIYTNNTIGIIVILISMIGGLILSMRLVATYFILLLNKIISIIKRQPQQQEQQLTGSIFD